MKYLKLTISIVVYNNNIATIKKVLDCISNIEITYRLFIVDNSPHQQLEDIVRMYDNLEYIKTNENLGYGKGHNIAIERSLHLSKYHLIINPDVFFESQAITELYEYMEENIGIGQVMPKILYENGEIQRLCKLLPRPQDLFIRRFLKKLKISNTDTYELKQMDYNEIQDIPSLSGCFMFIRTSALKQIKGFDPIFFLYLEDFDLTRRIHEIARTVYYPKVSIVHGFKKESYSSFSMMIIHIKSAIKYFNKWGWFWDKKRAIINKDTLRRIKVIGSKIY